MSKLPLRDLKWSRSLTTETLFRSYRVRSEGNGKFAVYYESETGEPATGFTSMFDAMDWAENTHYASEMQPYVNADSITDIANWFKAAKPEPTDKDICCQIGCHYEEVAEMDDALKASCGENERMAGLYKAADSEEVEHHINDIDHIELLDALCDQIVTATGVAYMMGFDIEGALKEVIRSNNSKMVKGKFEFDDNGKIAKPESYSKPDLTPFVKQGE